VTRAGIPPDIVLSDDDFERLRETLCARMGLALAPSTRPMLERRLRERLAALGLGSYAAYHDLLRDGRRVDDEWEALYDTLTTSETYFFREARQLKAFETEILPRIAVDAQRRRRLTVWSAGCSSGEEAYTIAILILGSGLFAGWDVHVVGTDISRRRIAAARRGVYGPGSFRTTPDDKRRTYFVERPGGTHVASRVRALCNFTQMNLLDPGAETLVGRVDVIFCRNVFIYLDARAREAAIRLFYESVMPGGVLLLGHSESLLNMSTRFELLHLKEDLVYERPRTSELRL
jgi:chemotaxis protein methyltransferase CheR